MKEHDLIEYSAAWNAHDIDLMMSFHTENCIFEMAGGAEQYGTRVSGSEAVRGSIRNERL